MAQVAHFIYAVRMRLLPTSHCCHGTRAPMCHGTSAWSADMRAGASGDHTKDGEMAAAQHLCGPSGRSTSTSPRC